MRERPDGMLEAENFAEHMAPGVRWMQDPEFAAAFDNEAQGSGLEAGADNRPKAHGLGVPHGMLNVWPIALGVWALLVLLALWATR